MHYADFGEDEVNEVFLRVQLLLNYYCLGKGVVNGDQRV